MLERREIVPDLRQALGVDVPDDNTGALVALGQDDAPRVDEHAVAIRAPAVVVHAALRPRAGSLIAIGTVPPTSQMPWSLARRERKACCAPAPSASRTATLSLARAPKMPKYSGSTTSRAP